MIILITIKTIIIKTTITIMMIIIFFKKLVTVLFISFNISSDYITRQFISRP